MRRLFSLAFVLTAWPAFASQGEAVQARMDAAAAAGEPLVVHVVVALADNEHQGIVPVRATLGDGDAPRSNLYWGARYGLRTYFTRDAGWRELAVAASPRPEILERRLYARSFLRGGRRVEVRLLAEAWRGREIRAALEHFLRLSAGHDAQTVEVAPETAKPPTGGDSIRAGGDAHLVVYVGHNGLMEHTLDGPLAQRAGAPPRAAVVLACDAHDHFASHLGHAGAHELVTTTGLMAPEAYTLAAIVSAWARKASPAETRAAAARAYHRYQRCGVGAARRLFTGAD